MDIQQAIGRVIEGRDLSRAEMAAVMRAIMTGAATPAQIGGLLVALRMKGETVEEITGAAEVMRELVDAVPIKADHLIDIVGTGGDGTRTFNISTASAFVAAAAGAKVAKHGNRSVSSSSGSADVLEAAGLNLELSPAQIAICVERVGVGFMFAPRHHQAMKYAIGPRRELGTRTLFNLLGPLTNPAAAPNELMGVFAPRWTDPLAHVLAGLGSHHALVVSSESGMDEISVSEPTHVAELRDGQVRNYELTPQQFGIDPSPDDALRVENAEQSLAALCAVLDNQPGPARDIVWLNAGAAIYVSGLADSIAAGVKRAAKVIADGSAKQKLQALLRLSHEL
jgi:anthranilate phosphoribosyltransferase